MTRRRNNLICLSLAFFLRPVIAAEQHYYLEYETFRALTALAPEAPEPRLASLPEGGFELWAHGQMRLPAGDILVEGDFNSDGLPEVALVFRSQSHQYLLIARKINGRWVRQALMTLQQQSGVTLNGNILVLAPPETFVAWDGHQYRMASAPRSAVSPAPTKTSVRAADALQTPAATSATVSIPFHFFTELNPQDLRSVDVRLSYRGPSHGSLPDLTFVSEEMSRDVRGKFFRSIPIPTVLLKQLLEALRKPLDSVTSPTEPKPFPWLLLATEAHSQGPTKTFQASFNSNDAKGIFLVFRRTLEGHHLAQYHLQSWGCGIGLLPEGHAIEVTSRVGIKMSPSSEAPWERVTKYLQKGRAAPSEVNVTVTNQSSSTITGPISVVFNLSGSARVADSDGTTCHTSPVGRDFVHLTLRNNQLPPAETVEMPVRIENPEKESVTFDLKVLAGPDPR